MKPASASRWTEPGQVFAYERFECDTSVAYRSVVIFGHIRVVEERDARTRFFDAPRWRNTAIRPGKRPAGFYPRLDQITLCSIAVERLSGKETVLPARR